MFAYDLGIALSIWFALSLLLLVPMVLLCAAGRRQDGWALVGSEGDDALQSLASA